LLLTELAMTAILLQKGREELGWWEGGAERDWGCGVGVGWDVWCERKFEGVVCLGGGVV